jgi:hypothetical protein
MNVNVLDRPMSHISEPQSQQVIGEEVLFCFWSELWMYKPEEGLVIAGQGKQRLRCRGRGPQCTQQAQNNTLPCGIVRQS